MDFFNLTKKEEVKFVDTALIVEDVKAVAKLFTQVYVNELIVTKTHKSESWFGGKDNLILIANGKCYAGTDLSKMTKEDIKITDSISCEVSIPKAEILETIINPSDIEVFKSEGYWEKNYKATQKVKTEATEKLRKLALNNFILQKADQKALKIMTDFMHSIGYKNVNVQIKS